jgi:hypothetical protein
LFKEPRGWRERKKKRTQPNPTLKRKLKNVSNLIMEILLEFPGHNFVELCIFENLQNAFSFERHAIDCVAIFTCDQTRKLV